MILGHLMFYIPTCPTIAHTRGSGHNIDRHSRHNIDIGTVDDINRHSGHNIDRHSVYNIDIGTVGITMIGTSESFGFSIRPIARIFQRGFTWMSALYVCIHKHARLGACPQKMFRN